MNIKVVIIENLSIVKGSKKESLLASEIGYFSFDGRKIKKIYKIIDNTYSTTALLGGLWISDKNRNITEFHDVYGLNVFYPPIPYIISDIDFYSNTFVASTSGVRKRKLISFDVKTKKTIEREFLKGLKFKLNDEYIYIRSDNERLVEAYTYGLDKVWSYTELEGDCYLDYDRAPQIHNDLLIISHAYDTIALDKLTGKEVWRHTFADIPTSNVLMQDKIYVVCKAILYILNPQTGEIELERDTGYPEFFPPIQGRPSDKNHIGIFPVGDYLYGIARYAEGGKIVRLYDKNCKSVLCDYAFKDYYLNPFESIKPVIHQNTIYQPVRNLHSYSDSGVLVLELTNDKAKAGIYVAPRPPVTMLAKPSLSAEHKQQVFLDVDNLDDALRYGEIYVKELQFATGFISTYRDRINAFDTLHNGEIELIIDVTGFEQGTEEYFDGLSQRLKEFLESDTCKAGDKKTPIHFKLIKQPKKEWDMSGDKLDWPAIRDQETPIS